MKYYIVAEVREDHKNLSDKDSVYNDYVSRKSMLDFAEACRKNGYDCKFIGGMDSLLEIKRSEKDLSECIFINYNYGYPSNFKRAQSPILLETMRAKYSGSDPLTSLLVNDKAFSKKILSNIVKTPKSILVLCDDDINSIEIDSLKLPIVVKPNSEGSSLGIDTDSFCSTYETAKNKAKSLINTYDQILIEEYIEGFEVTVWIIGNKNKYELVQPLIVSTNGIYYFENKIFTMNDKANRIRSYSLPNSVLSTTLINELIQKSIEIFEELGIRDYGRIDFRIFNNDIYFIEANALPIFSQTSEIGKICEMCNITYDSICKKMITAIEGRLMSEAY